LAGEAGEAARIAAGTVVVTGAAVVLGAVECEPQADAKASAPVAMSDAGRTGLWLRMQFPSTKIADN